MGKNLTIGVLIGNANSPHAKSFMRGVYDAAEKMDVNLIFFLGVHMTSYFSQYQGQGTEDRFDYQYNVVYDYAHLADVDGLIIPYGAICIFSEDKNKAHFMDKFKNIPYVLVEERDEQNIGSSIISDNYKGMYRIVEHLVTVHQCRKLCFVSGPDDNTDAKERAQAFLDVLKVYGIDFCDSMTARGDYSQACGKQIGEVLDRYPDADALVCANDIMAETAYQECAKRGLVVGKDIAITGYDDWEMAKSMLPPLTTVLQNELDMGYESVKAVISLCNGEEPKEMKAPTEVKIRASCGCRIASEYCFERMVTDKDILEENKVNNLIDALCKRVLQSQVGSDIQKDVRSFMKKIFINCVDIYRTSDTTSNSYETLMDNVNELFTGRCGRYISATAFGECINEYIKYLFIKENDTGKLQMASEIAGVLQQYIQSCVITQSNMRENQSEQDTMFVPLISRDMIANIDDAIAFCGAPMYILNLLRVKSAYLYMLPHPCIHKYGQEWVCPENMYLVSYLEDGRVTAYGENDWKAIDSGCGMCSKWTADRKRRMTVLNLFQGEQQYGVLMVEVEPQDMLLMHLVSLQISNALSFYCLYRQQKNTQEQLEVLIDEVNEKNKILGYVSGYDELTGILNRRGFMEEAMKFVHSHSGKTAVLLIADLDHLKQINDNYGHISGDYAIKTSAQILKKVLGEDALAARMGGDEFVSIQLADSELPPELLVNRIKIACEEANASSGKEFYVELSVGYTMFTCDSLVDFEAILSNSDKMLYEAKKVRRASVKKHI